MRVLIVHNAVSAESLASDQDTLVQVDTVRGALVRLGHQTEVLPCTLNLEALAASIQAANPDVVFDLVESLAGSDRLQHLVPAVFDSLPVRYTGARTQSIFLTVDKLMAKQCLEAAGLPTPRWQSATPAYPAPIVASKPDSLTRSVRSTETYIIKAVAEHASFGLEDDLLIRPADDSELDRQVADTAQCWGRECFAEQYIEGREFNLALLTTGRRSDEDRRKMQATSRSCLRPRSIFRLFHPGSRAWWVTEPSGTIGPSSFTILRGPSTFLVRPTAARRACRLARQCWSLFRLQGYARVDFRVDAAGRPWILEVNVNPCLSPDAGFAAAIARAGISFEEAVERILADVAIRKSCDARKKPMDCGSTA